MEDHIPATDVVDGWRIEFDTFLIVLGDITVNTTDGTTTSPKRLVLDLRKSSAATGHPTLTLDVVEAPVESVGYSMLPATAETTTPNASEADLQMIKDEGFSLYVRGVAVRGAEQEKFAWGFWNSAVFGNCETDGVIGKTPSWLTIHADYLFSDNLEGVPRMSFDLIASADSNEDGNVTPEELQLVDITGQSRHQVGSRPITNLWQIIEAQTKRFGHIDRDGVCEADESGE